MKQVTASLAVLALLLLGFLAGVLGTHLFYARKFEKAGSLPMMASEFFAERLKRDLDLTEEQSDAIEEILDETRQRADTVRRELRPQVAALMEDSSERIREILTPEQRQEFEKLRAKHRRLADMFFLGPPGRRGPGGPPGLQRMRGPGGRWEDRRPPREEGMPEAESGPPESEQGPSDDTL